MKNDSVQLLECDQNGFKNIWTFQNREPGFLEFDPTNPERLYYKDNNLLLIKNCKDFSSIDEISLANNNLLNIDYFNGEILTYSNNTFNVLSLATGKLLKQIEFNSNINFESCKLINRTIINQNGLMYFIQ